MANKQLVDFLTAENELDGQEPVYIAQNGKTRKTLLQKIKEFIIGTTSMGTEAEDVTGAVAELKGKIDLNSASLNASTNIQDITFVNGWVKYDDSYSEPKCIKIGKMVMASGMIKSGTSSTLGYLPEGYRPKKTEPICVQLGDGSLVGGLIGSDGVIICTGAESKNSVLSLNFSFIAE